MKLSIHNLIQTKPLSNYERKRIHNLINKTLNNTKGDNQDYLFNIGDKVTDKNGRVDIITEQYRENGHNRYATSKYFYREQDLILTK